MKLLLAVDIADRVRDALSQRRPINVELEANDLLARHPEAHASVEEVIAIMQYEIKAGSTGRPSR